MAVTVFVLGFLDGGRSWFLGRGASFGNMMSTLDPATARTWPSIVELELWVDALPDTAKAQIADRELLILPLEITVGNAVDTVTLETVTPETKETPAERVITRRPAKTKTKTESPASLFA
ncbi:MAG: hypothetical protein P4L84_11340 [Isosphaeraceae bacterium]|nr:hypothetical protein [Isosphaeraceae bacterium]